MWYSVRLLSSFLFLGLHFSFYGSLVDAATTEAFKIPYRCPEATYHCVYDGRCYSYKYLCVPDDTSTPPSTTDALAVDTSVQPEDSTTVGNIDLSSGSMGTTVGGSTETPNLDSTTEDDGETTLQEDKSTDLVTKSEMTTQPSAQDQTSGNPVTDDQTGPDTTITEGSKFFDSSTAPVTGESTSIPETAETTLSVGGGDPKTTKAAKEVPSSTDQTTPGVTAGRVTDESSTAVTSDQSTPSPSTSSITSSSIAESSSPSPTVDTASSSSTQTTSSQTSSTPITTALSTTFIPSRDTTVPLDVPGPTSIKTTPATSNSVILVFKGILANPYHFNATLVMDLAAMLNESMQIAPNPFILRLHQFGPKNSTVTSEVSAVQSYTDENFKTVSRVVPSTEILAALSGNITADWKIADLEFVCGYPSKDKPCVTLPLPYTPRIVTTDGLFENNKDLFIAIFVLASLILLILVLGLIYLRCRQRRCSSYETNNVKLEKAKLTNASEVNPEINSPLSDKEILKGEMETSLSQNGAPPLDKDAGWIIPLDQILDNGKNTISTDTKL